MARGYQKTKELLPVIKEKLASGMSQREIENELGLKGDRPIHQLLKRERRREKTLPRQRGRKPAVTLQEYQYENKRLKQENEMLRDFLQSLGRR